MATNGLRISNDVTLPVELTTRRSAIFGISGSGKSNTATVCIERLLEAGEQVVLIDPKGEGWGLQTSADGKRAAFDIIVFGQPRGDIPELREEHAEQIADFVVDSGRSVVLSLLGFETDQAERRFVEKFFTRLYRRKSQMPVKTRTLVVLEEAHLFVPEQASGSSTSMVASIKRIARQGRAAGLGLMIVDQRPQEVAKSIISQSELLICHQLVHKLDRKALEEWVRAYDTEGQGDTFFDTLAELQPGEAWAWSPGWLKVFKRTKIDRRKTYDSGATPDGDSPAAPNAKASVDLDKLRTHLAKVVEQVKANDPAELRRQLSAANAELAKLRNAPAPVGRVETKTVEKLIVSDKQVQRLEQLAARLDAHLPGVGKVLTFLQQKTDEWRKFGDDLTTGVREIESAVRLAKQPTPATNQPAIAGVGRVAPPAPARPRVATVATPRPSPGTPVEAVTPAQQKILDALAWWKVVGVDLVEKGVLAVIAGYTVNGHFNNVLGSLRSAGLIDYPQGGTAAFTDAGQSAAHFPPGPGTLADLHAAWRAKLSPAQWKIIEQVMAEHPRQMEKEELAERAGYTVNGHFNNVLGSLRSLGIVTKRGSVGATDLLYPAGMA